RPRLLAAALAGRDPSDVAAIGSKLYLLAVVPLPAPEPIAWLAAGFAIDDRAAADLRRLSGLHVSFVARRDGDVVVHASTLGAADRRTLASGLLALGAAGVLELDGGEHPVRIKPVGPGVL